MKIFLTGATGMVGRNILESHQFKDHEIFAPTRSEADLSDFSEVLNSIEKFQPDLVLHCAGRVGGIQANLNHPVSFLVENLDIGRNVIMAAYQAKVKKLINLGTSCMYPREATNPLVEEAILSGPLEPTNEGYAIAKIAAQRLCAAIVKENSEFQYKTLIPCNLYGRFDKFDPVHAHLVPAIIYKIHWAKQMQHPQVAIWGDGKARREFLFCDDLVDCLAKAVDSYADGGSEHMPELMNVGLGFDYTVNEYYQMAAKVIGYVGEFVHDLSKPVGMKQKLVSVEKLRAWGWQSKTSLHEGLVQTYEYFLKTPLAKKNSEVINK